MWGEALLSAMYVINRVPSSVLGYQTPLQVLQAKLKTIPPVPNLPPKVFGCVVYVHVHPHQRSKLDPCAIKCVFVGYASHQKGYRCYHPPTRKMYVTMDVTFHEELSYFTINGSPLQEESDSLEENNHEWLTISSSTSDSLPCLDAETSLSTEGESPLTFEHQPNGERITDAENQESDYQTPQTETNSPLSPRLIQPTPEALNEVTSESNDRYCR